MVPSIVEAAGGGGGTGGAGGCGAGAGGGDTGFRPSAQPLRTRVRIIAPAASRRFMDVLQSPGNRPPHRSSRRRRVQRRCVPRQLWLKHHQHSSLRCRYVPSGCGGVSTTSVVGVLSNLAVTVTPSKMANAPVLKLVPTIRTSAPPPVELVAGEMLVTTGASPRGGGGGGPIGEPVSRQPPMNAAATSRLPAERRALKMLRMRTVVQRVLPSRNYVDT